jgi:gas vesicle protein
MIESKMGKEKKVVYSMASGCLFAAFLYIFLVTWLPIPQTGVDHSKVIIGFLLGSVIGTIIGMYWGTSKGSQAQSDTIDAQIKNAANMATVASATPEMRDELIKQQADTAAVVAETAQKKEVT